MYFASYVFPSRFLKYEFANYKRAIERGVGLCSQSVIVEAAVLRRRALNSGIVLLSGEHVVMQAEVSDEPDGEWWVLDPDYGVTIPYSISEIQKNPQLVADYYAKAGYDEATVRNLVRIYGLEDITVINRRGARWYHIKKFVGEKVAYVLIWVIPVVLMAPWGIHMQQSFRTRRHASAP